MLTSETKRRIDACRDILVGKLPLPTDQVELITLALIYKFMDDLDEESVAIGGKRSFFTGVLAKYRWRNLLPQTVSAEARMTLFAEGIEALGHAQKAAHLPGLFRDIFRNAFLKFRDGRILTLFLTEVNGFAYSHSEELGNAFEYLLQCMGTQGENGQFRTPRHIIDFIVGCLDPQPGDRILDPACGTGGFLVSAFRHILARHTSGPDGRDGRSGRPGDLLTHAQRQAVYQNLAGYDITDLMVKLSKVNLFLHGFPDPAIHIYDTLSNDARWPEKADLILANPPFMTPKGGVTPHTRFRIAARKAEVLFTDYIAEHLAPDGRAGVIVPNGIVATTQNAYVKLRRYLVEDSLVAVVSLPAGVFKPYSGVKTSILLLDKKLARTAREILFLKITADGFDLGDKRTPIAANDLPEAERVVKAWLHGELEKGGVGKGDATPASAAGANVRAKGPTPFQPGATPQETDAQNILKGHRPAPSHHGNERAADRTGLQPSDLILHDAPGALPQAGMGSAVGAQGQRPASSQPGPSAQDSESAPAMRAEGPVYRVAWKALEKRALLETKDATLVAERFLGVAENNSEHHPMVRLGNEELFRLESGGTPSTTKPEFWDGPHAWATLVDLPAEDLVTNLAKTERTVTDAGLKNSSAVLLPVGTVIVSTRATLGRVAVARIPVATNQGFKNIIIKNAARALPEYVALVVTRLRPQMLEFAAGGTFKEISKSNFALLEIPLPPLEEQRRIVAEIAGYQQVLDGARQILAGYKPRVDAHPDWPVAPLSDAAELTGGYAFKSTEMKPAATISDFPVVKIGNVGRDGRLDMTDAEFHSFTPDLARFVLHPGDIAVAMTGATVGKVAEVDRDNLLLNQRVGVVRRKETAEQKFLLHVLRGPDFYNYCQTTAGGGAQGNISPRQILEYEIPLPSLPEQRRLVAELDAEAVQMDSVRALLPRFEAKIQRVLDRVWGNGVEHHSWGVAPRWYGTGLWPEISAPTARRYPSLGQRPR